MEQLGSHWTEFHEILSMKDFPKSVTKIKVSLKSDKNNVRVLYMETNMYFYKLFLE